MPRTKSDDCSKEEMVAIWKLSNLGQYKFFDSAQLRQRLIEHGLPVTRKAAGEILAKKAQSNVQAVEASAKPRAAPPPKQTAGNAGKERALAKANGMPAIVRGRSLLPFPKASKDKAVPHASATQPIAVASEQLRPRAAKLLYRDESEDSVSSASFKQPRSDHDWGESEEEENDQVAFTLKKPRSSRTAKRRKGLDHAEALIMSEPRPVHQRLIPRLEFTALDRTHVREELHTSDEDTQSQISIANRTESREEGGEEEPAEHDSCVEPLETDALFETPLSQSDF